MLILSCHDYMILRWPSRSVRWALVAIAAFGLLVSGSISLLERWRKAVMIPNYGLYVMALVVCCLMILLAASLGYSWYVARDKRVNKWIDKQDKKNRYRHYG